VDDSGDCGKNPLALKALDHIGELVIAVVTGATADAYPSWSRAQFERCCCAVRYPCLPRWVLVALSVMATVPVRQRGVSVPRSRWASRGRLVRQGGTDSKG
jgi:hypothetical protein